MKQLVFHHIPKCAGMSLVMGLAVSYYPVQLIRYGKKGFTGRLNARAAHETAGTRGLDDYALRREILHYQLEWADAPFISGHYPFCPQAYESFKDEWDFVTVLRDPVTRWYSEYDWNRYKDHDYKKTDLDIEGYFETPQGQEDARLYMNFFVPREHKSAPASQEDLNAAKIAIEGFTVIGDVKNMDGFKARMKRVYGRKPWIPNRNSSPAPDGQKTIPDKNSDFHKKLVQTMEADIEFYNHAKALMK